MKKHVVGLALLLACSPGTSSAPGTVRIALSGPVNTFDPTASDSSLDFVLWRQVWEGLFEFDPLRADGSVQPLLAQSFEISADGLTWTFHLREDAFFFDPSSPPLWPEGRRPIVAEDVVHSWTRALQGRGSFFLDDLLAPGDRAMEVVDGNTVVLHLARPTPSLPTRLASPWAVLVPAEAVTRQNPSLRDMPVGTGPFFLDSFEPGRFVRFLRTPNWRKETDALGSLPRPLAIEASTVPDGSVRTALFRRGEVDRLSLQRDSFHALVGKDGLPRQDRLKRKVELKKVAVADLSMIVFRMADPTLGHLSQDTSGNLRRRWLRQALSLAFPYEAWNKTMRNGIWGRPATQFLPPGIPGAESCATLAHRREDIPAAAALLERAGWPQGKGLPKFRFSLPGADPDTLAMGELLKAGWRRIGVELDLQPLTALEFRRRVAAGEVQVFPRKWTLDWPDALNLLTLFHGPEIGNLNQGGFFHADFDAGILALRSSLPSEEHSTTLASVVAILGEEVPCIPIDHTIAWVMHQPWLQVPAVHPLDPLPIKAWTVGQRP